MMCPPHPFHKRFEEKISDEEEILIDDEWMVNFGCEGIRALERYVILPDEETVFNENFMQRVHLELRDKKFVRKLTYFIKGMEEKMKKMLVKNPIAP